MSGVGGDPDRPRVRLGRAIDRAAELARQAVESEGRLHELIAAMVDVNQSLERDEVLAVLADRARSVLRSEAAGVLVTRDGHTVEAAGVGEGARSAHPPWHLAVPLGVMEQDDSVLYVIRDEGGPFSREDEQLLLGLVVSAQSAVDHAQLFDRAARRRTWLEASASAMRQLWGASDASPLESVLRQAVLGAEADGGALLLPDPDGAWAVEAVSYAPGVEVPLAESTVSARDSIATLAMTSGAPQLTDDYAADFGASAIADIIGPAIAAPIRDSRDRVLGALFLGRRRGGSTFTPFDLELVGGFTQYIGLALELSRLRRVDEALSRFGDHERIAAALLVEVVPGLSEAGSMLAQLASRLEGSPREVAVEAAAVIAGSAAGVRRVVAEAPAPPRGASRLRQRVLAAVDAEALHLGSAPSVTFVGEVEHPSAAVHADAVVAALRLGLRRLVDRAHPMTEAASVRIEAADGYVTVDVFGESEADHSWWASRPPSRGRE